MNRESAEQLFYKIRKERTKNQLQKELNSWIKYINKPSSLAAYGWHGKDITPPNSLADGDKVSFLKDIIANCKSDKSEKMCYNCDCWKKTMSLCM